jgi:hypothetical protein
MIQKIVSPGDLTKHPANTIRRFIDSHDLSRVEIRSGAPLTPKH